MTSHVSFTCPVCCQPLVEVEDNVACLQCGSAYPQTLGIPDLRRPGAARSNTDAVIVEHMVACYCGATYAELLEIRLRGMPNYGDLIGHEVNYHLDHAARAGHMVAMFLARLACHARTGSPDTALDIGCGSGGSLLALARQYTQVVGIDPSLPDLILARKSLEMAATTNVRLVQGFGEALPFADDTFDYINVLNVLEHVSDLDGLLRESRRVLRPGGSLAGDSRNRYDLFLPEPHVKVRWVGLLPKRLANRYVRWRKGVGYEGTYLHSYCELRRALARQFGSDWRVIFPLVAAYGGPAWVDRWLRRLERLPLLPGMLLWVFPSHLVLAWVAT
jgi:SAM-dependent methyltransferase